MEQFGRHAGSVPASVATAVRAKTSGKAAAAAGGRGKDRSDRATVEQVLDPRTRMVRHRLGCRASWPAGCRSVLTSPGAASGSGWAHPTRTRQASTDVGYQGSLTRGVSLAVSLQVLFKMLNRGVFDEINGCVSTGKEANVYHATGRDADGGLQVGAPVGCGLAQDSVVGLSRAGQGARGAGRSPCGGHRGGGAALHAGGHTVPLGPTCLRARCSCAPHLRSGTAHSSSSVCSCAARSRDSRVPS